MQHSESLIDLSLSYDFSRLKKIGLNLNLNDANICHDINQVFRHCLYLFEDISNEKFLEWLTIMVENYKIPKKSIVRNLGYMAQKGVEIVRYLYEKYDLRAEIKDYHFYPPSPIRCALMGDLELLIFFHQILRFKETDFMGEIFVTSECDKQVEVFKYLNEKIGVNFDRNDIFHMENFAREYNQQKMSEYASFLRHREAMKMVLDDLLFRPMICL